MNILASLKAFLMGTEPLPAAPAPVVLPSADTLARIAAYETRLAEGFRRAAVQSEQFRQHYGEFTKFFYRPDFDAFLRKQVLLFWEPGTSNKAFLDNNHWSQIHPFNFPGPFYAGESDTCGTGIGEAPDNVVNDDWGCEYVFKQPSSYYELLCVLNAAAVEVLDSYSSNGNDYWTYAACRQWWHNRPQLLHHLSQPKVVAANDGHAQRYAAYLQGDAELDLRRYCYFLEHGTYPPHAHTPLPTL
jgi:hypothetical protein